jgi:maleylpyruvate isomerase
MGDKLVLHGFYRSSASYRVRIALNLKAMDFVGISKHLRSAEHRSAEFLALNSQGLVPVLEHDGEAFNQSLAIIEYLDEIDSTVPLLPEIARDRAIVRAMANVIACEMHPLCNLRVLKYLKLELGSDEASVNAWYGHWMKEGFATLETMVQKHGDRRHCFGNQITLADVCLVPQVYNATRFECDLSPYPTVLGIVEALEENTAFADAHPDNQPDAGS